MRRIPIIMTLIVLSGMQGLFGQDVTDSAYTSQDFLFQITGSKTRTPMLNLLGRQAEVTGFGTDTVYRLPDEMILFESETVEIGTMRLFRGTDYSFNYRYGEIRFAVPIASGVKVTVRYRIFPFGLSGIYRRRDTTAIQIVTESSRSIQRKKLYTGTVTQENPFFGQSNISGSGSITRGFTIGTNQDFTLNSGLNIQIAGQLTDDVTIEASLTDESTPIQPEGNTETLQEIDKVFIEIRKADRYSATFGDFDFQLKGTEFGAFSRKLQGVKASVNTDRVKADVTFAASEGRYASNTLVMSEGVQGPYELSGAGGEKNIIIIAGTEKVWLNGILMRRGEDQDYVIDYSAAQMTFTRRRLITPESRVVVDFEYTEELYRRNTLAGQIQTQWMDGRIRFGGLFIREYDDKNNPVNLSLSKELTDSLSRIDDRTVGQGGNIIWVSGASWAGAGRGAYIRFYDPAIQDTIFIYKGADSTGDYNVRFTNVGAGRGDYSRGLILGEFRYAGKNQGDFLPLVPLTLPTTNTLGSVFLEARPNRIWTVYSEVAFSGFDVNAYSPGQVTGKAYHVSFRADKQPLKIGTAAFGEIDLSARLRHRDSLFNEVSRLDHAEFSRSWNIGPDAAVSRAQNREVIREFSAEYRPRPYMTLAPYYGFMEKGDRDFLSERMGGSFGLNKDRWPLIRYRYDRIATSMESSTVQSKANVGRQLAQTSYRFWKIEPGFEYESEIIRNRWNDADSLTGSEYQTYRPKLDIPGFSKTQFGFSYERRYDKLKNSRIDSLNGTVSVASTSRLYWTVSGWKNLNSTLEFTQRRKEFAGRFRTADNPDKLTRLVNSTVDYFPLNRAVQLTLNYQVSEEQIQNRKIIFISVGPNQGNYIQVAQDSFVQVPQGQGDWIQGSVRANRFTPVVELTAGFRLRIELYRWMTRKEREIKERSDTIVPRESRGGFWRWLMMNAASETFFRVEENQASPVWSFYFLNLNQYLKTDRTVRGTLLIRQDVIFFPQKAERTVRLRYEHQRNLTNLLVDGRDQRLRSVRNIRWREQLTAQWATENEVEYETHRKRSQIAFSAAQPDFTIRRFKTIPSVSFRPKNHIELILKGQWINAKENITNRNATILIVMPEINYAFQSKGRLTANAEMAKVRITPAGGIVLYELADGNQRGTTYRWMIHADYRIGEHLSMNLNYSGRREPGQETIHIAGAELRAFF